MIRKLRPLLLLLVCVAALAAPPTSLPIGRLAAQTAPGSSADEAAADPLERARVVVVPVVGNPGASMTRLVQRGLTLARQNGIARVVLDIDTPLEAVDDLGEISPMLTALRSAREDGAIRVSAYVARQAQGYGGYLALGVDDLYMSSSATLGPVSPLPPGLVGIELQQFDADYGVAVTEFVAGLQQLVGQRGAGPDAQLLVAALADPTLDVYEVTFVDAGGIEQTGLRTAEQLGELTANGAEILRRDALGNAPLALDAATARRHGLVRGVHDSFDEVAREEFALTPGEVYRLDTTWSESAVSWLERMKPLLFLFGFLLLLLEVKAPGTFIPATFGIILIGVGLFSSYLVGLADWTEILLFVLGLGLIGVELLVVPGMLVFGVAGFLMVLVSLVLSQQNFVIPTDDVEFAVLTGNLVDLLLLMLCTMAGGLVLQRLLPKAPLFRRVMLQPPADHSLTGDATRFRAIGGDGTDTSNAMLGQVLTAVTDLRPSGIAETAEGRREDVVAEGGFLKRGSKVRVLDVQGNRIVVEPVVETGPGTDESPSESSAAGGERGEVAFGLLVMLVLLGLALVVAEVFFVSAGILSVAAAVSLISAVFLAFTQHGETVGFGFLFAAAVGVPTVLMFALKLLPRTALGRKIILSGPRSEDVHAAAQEPGLDELLGKSGVSASRLRPSGYARIDGRRVDVVTRGEMIDQGVAVRVLAVDSNRVVVGLDEHARSAPPTAQPTPPAGPSS